jgi:hypothetical protein|uniref:Uncharacterized protein n=1 Tax=viral metagenome TaxID=1070528 RepID=A0A6C0B2M5_9ZZZZ
MKYLIVKGGPSGFGDRLECLIMYIKFALTKNLKIYVDWVDPIWSHNGESFYTYFDLVNIPKLNSIDDIPADATIHPKVWEGKLKLPYTREMGLTTELGQLTDQEFNADVIVASSNGYRLSYSDLQFFANVFRVIDQRIISKVVEKQKKFDLRNKIGIHLRGTDRATKVDKSHRMAGINIRMVTAGMLNKSKFVAVSDDREFLAMWKNRYPDFPVLTEIEAISGTKGVHQLTKNEVGVPKDLLNVDLLVDFFSLGSCRNIISTSKDSRFANNSKKLGKFIDKMFLPI